MEPHALLIAKLVLVVVLSHGIPFQLERPFLPLAGGWSHLTAAWLAPALDVCFLAAAAALLLNRVVRIAALVLGVVTICRQLTSAPDFHAHLMLGGAMLMLAPLHRRDEQPWLLRALVGATLVAVAAVQATSDGWLDGRLIKSWFVGGLAHPLFAWMHETLSGDWLAIAVAWLVVVAQFALAVALMIPRARNNALWALVLGLVLNGFLLATPEMQALAIVLGVVCLSFLRWPGGAVAVLWPRACGYPLWLRIALDRYDWDGRLDWPLPPDPDAILEVDMDERHFENSRALTALLLHFPAFIFAAFALLWATHLALPAAVGSVIHAMLIGPVLALFAMRRIKRVLREPRRAGG